MAVKQDVLVLEVTGDAESIQTQIKTALDALSVAPTTTCVPSVIIHGTNGRYIVILSYVIA